MSEPNLTICRRADVVTEAVGDGYMIIPIDGENVNQVLSVNETGGFVWKQLETPKTVSELTAALVAEYDIPPEEAASDLNDFLELIKDYCIITGKD